MHVFEAISKAMTPQVLNLRNLPAGAEYVLVARPSKWGNPFKIGRDGTREQVIQKYGVWLVGQEALMAQVDELIGKNVACWCAPLPCHGDVLVALAEIARFNATQFRTSAGQSE